MGNKQQHGDKETKTESLTYLSPQRRVMLISGLARQYLDHHQIIAQDIILLVCTYSKWHQAFTLDSASLPSLSLQCATCKGSFGFVSDVAVYEDWGIALSQDGKAHAYNIQQAGLRGNGKQRKRRKSPIKLWSQRKYSAETSWLLVCAMNANYLCYGGLNNRLHVIPNYKNAAEQDAKLIDCIPPNAGAFYIECSGYIAGVLFMDNIDPNKTYILVASGDSNCYVFDVNEPNKPYKTWSIADSDVMGCDFHKYSVDRTLIVFGTAKYIYVADFYSKDETYLAKQFVSTTDVHALSISPNGECMVTGDGDGMINIFNISAINWHGARSAEQLQESEEYTNGIERICQLYTTNPGITAVKFADEQHLIAATDNGRALYIKMVSDTIGWGELKTSHDGHRISSLSIYDHILMFGSWDLTASLHDLRGLRG